MVQYKRHNLRPEIELPKQKKQNRFLLKIIHFLVRLATRNTYKQDE